MRSDTRRYIVAYDVEKDRNRARLSNLLQSFGDRIQYSVFVVDCIPAVMVQLRDKVTDLIDTGTDSVLFCDLGQVSNLGKTKYSYVGIERQLTDNEMLII